MKRKLTAILALIGMPDLIYFDEISSGLDIYNGREFLL
jgi:ABC-type multidrug transport system ATPase subunit